MKKAGEYMLNELLCSLRENISISDIVAVLSMIGAIIAAFVSWSHKRRAAKSEAQAEQYAKNADEANQSAKKYYEIMYGQAKAEDDAHRDREAIKDRILAYIKRVQELGGNNFEESKLFSEEFQNNRPPELRDILKELEERGDIEERKAYINDTEKRYQILRQL